MAKRQSKPKPKAKPAAKPAPAKRAAKAKPAAKRRPAVARGPTPSVVVAVRRDLKELERIKAGISASALAATALAMARELDDRENSASGMASCARVLDTVMAELRLSARRGREQTPNLPPPPTDGVDDLTARRAARRSGS